MLQNDIWYFSDTRSYTGSDFIKQNGGEATFKAMCETVGIDPEIVCDNDEHCGGAQSLLKNTDAAFWEKVERDCEALYVVMEDHNNRQAELIYKKYGYHQTGFVGVQSWCADMWVLFWNALLTGRTVRTHPDLNFLISKSPIEEWEKTKILHYSGEAIKAPGPIFRKINYIHFTPFYDLTLETTDFSKTASLPLVNLIREYRDKILTQRIYLKDVTFLIPLRIDSESRLKNLLIIVSYLYKYFDTNIIIAESDIDCKIDKSTLPPNCELLFIKDNDPFLHRTRVNNMLIRKAKTGIVAIYDSDVVFPIQQIVESVNEIRENKADMVSPYGGEFVGVPNLFKNMMAKILDPELLSLNIGKFQTVNRRSYGGAAFLNRESYILAGMENEYFTSWGPEDIERPKRMKNLGYTVKRVKGPLFHLPHERNINSGYPDVNYYVQFMEEYLKITDMNKENLQSYIKAWPWNNQ
jgi:predicted glycosyltransferase involved in capsule biosynthesis